MALDKDYDLTEAQKECIRRNLTETSDPATSQLQARYGGGIHSLYNNPGADRSVVESAVGGTPGRRGLTNNGLAQMYKLAGVNQPDLSEDEDLPTYMFDAARVAFLLERAGVSPSIIEKVSGEPTQRALDRMADAEKRSGLDGVITATASRLKATKDTDKLQGMAAAISVWLVKRKADLSDDQIKALKKIQAQAMAMSGMV